jgi:hypothetical protein
VSRKYHLQLFQIAKLIDRTFNKERGERERKEKKIETHQTLTIIPPVPLKRSQQDKYNDIKKFHQKQVSHNTFGQLMWLTLFTFLDLLWCC